MIELVNKVLNSDTLGNFVTNPQFIAFLIAISLEFFRRIIMPKARIIWGVGHGFNFLIPQRPDTERAQAIPNLPVNTRSMYVKNNGRAVAKNVEFYFNYKTEHYELWPVIEYNVVNTPNGRFIIKIPFIGKKEFFRIELIHSNSNPPEVMNVRAESGVCHEVNMAPIQVFSSFVNFLILLTMFLGIVQIISIFVSLIQAFVI